MENLHCVSLAIMNTACSSSGNPIDVRSHWYVQIGTSCHLALVAALFVHFDFFEVLLEDVRWVFGLSKSLMNSIFVLASCVHRRC